MPSKDGSINVEDAARALGAYPSRVLAALTDGAVPAEKVDRGRFRVADLDRLAAALGLGPRPASPDDDMAEPREGNGGLRPHAAPRSPPPTPPGAPVALAAPLPSPARCPPRGAPPPPGARAPARHTTGIRQTRPG